MTPKLSILSLHCSLFTTGSWVSHQKRCRLECNGEEGKKEDDEKEEAAAAMVVPPTAKSFSGNKVHEWNTMISWLEKSIVLEWLEKETSRAGRKLGVNNNNSNNNSSALSTWLLQLHQQANAPSSASSSGRCSVHARRRKLQRMVWRKRLRGKKSRGTERGGRRRWCCPIDFMERTQMALVFLRCSRSLLPGHFQASNPKRRKR